MDAKIFTVSVNTRRQLKCKELKCKVYCKMEAADLFHDYDRGLVICLLHGSALLPDTILTALQSSALSQLRTGINKLNGYLHKIHCSDTPLCDCDCNLVETVQHFLFTCPRWVEQRRSMRIAHGEAWGDLSTALRGKDRRRLAREEDDKEEWRPNRENVLATINFAIARGRLASKASTSTTTPPTSPTSS